jgi:hypothetical protein
VQVHYVPGLYPAPTFGDERLMSVAEWWDICNPSQIITFNDGLDYAKKEREFVKLCWWLIERKVAYYRPEAVHASWKPLLECSDDDYDAAEQRYLTLCRELERDNTIVHKGYPGFEDVPGAGMMEVDDLT